MDNQPAPKKKIMLVDDDDSVLDYLHVKLARHYEIVKTAKPLLALELARAQQPALILCDIDMPGMSGSELAAALARDPGTARIPLIHLTGLVSADEAHKLDLIAGGRPFVAKRAPVPELLERIDTVMRSAQASAA